MRTIYDDFVNADIELSAYVRSKKEMAKIEVLYFSDKGDVVRKILRVSRQEEKSFYDKGLNED